MTKNWTTANLEDALAARYTHDRGYALFFDVGDGVGGSLNRRGDAIMQGMWKNRGLHLTGFEIKASRSDWLRELKQPQKAESIMRFCTQWVLVAGPSVVKLDEDPIPEPWGVLVPRDDKLIIAKPPKDMTPAPITPEFTAALFRAALKERDSRQWVRRDHINTLINAEAELRLEKMNKMKEQSTEDAVSQLRYMKQQREEEQKVYYELSKALGVNLPDCGMFGKVKRDNMLKLLQVVSRLGFDATLERIGRVRRELGALEQEIDTLIKDVKDTQNEEKE